MKKNIIFNLLLVSTLTIAQTGKVGINTTTPTRTLDVEGDLRVKTLTDKSADAAYTNVMVHNPTTGAIDALPSTKLADGSGNEPWRIESSVSAAITNTQNIYQNANVGIGDFSSLNVGSKLEILGGGTRQLGLSESDTGSKWDISTETNALSFTLRRPTNNRKMIFRNDGSISADNFLPDDSSIGDFYYDGTNRRLILGAGNNPTEKLDVNGNARIRNLVDGYSDTSYTRTVVVKADGTLGAIATDKILINDNEGPKDETYPGGISDMRQGFSIFVNVNNTGCVNPSNVGDIVLFYINNKIYVDRVLSGTNLNDGNGGVIISGEGSNEITISHTLPDACIGYNFPNDLKITMTPSGKLRAYSTTNFGYFRYVVSWKH